MDFFIIGMSIILGCIIGSFLNVVMLRFNTGKSLKGRSQCFSCSHTLCWYELVPVFSWLFQRGLCRHCSSKISKTYVIGELLTGGFFGLITSRALFFAGDIYSSPYLVSTLFLFVLFSILLVILFYDIRHKIIPDSLSFAFGILSFTSLFFFSFQSSVFSFVGFQLPSLWAVLAGALVPLPFIILWIVSKGRWIGLGDPKLMVGMGFLFGMTRGFSSVFLAFWIGALFALGVLFTNKVLGKTLLRRGKKSIMKEEIPFAPFLILATLATLVFNFNLFV